MGRDRRGAPIGFLVFALVGSTLVGVGLGCSIEDGTIEALGPGSPDSANVGVDATSQDDGGAPHDGGADVSDKDVGVHPFDAACGETLSAGMMTAFKSTHTKVIDGADDDWGCEAPFVLTGADAADEHTNDGGYYTTGACKFEWSPTKIYFFCDVTDPTPGDGTSTNLTVNDAVEMYVAGTPVASRSGNYGAFAHQYVVDWRGMTAEYDNGTQNAVVPTALDAVVTTHTGGYDVEGSIDDTALLSGSSLAPSMTIGFDLGIDDGAGQQIGIVWAQGTHAGCGSCTIAFCCCAGDNGPGSMDYPYCDALAFGSMTLSP